MVIGEDAREEAENSSDGRKTQKARFAAGARLLNRKGMRRMELAATAAVMFVFCAAWIPRMPTSPVCGNGQNSSAFCEVIPMPQIPPPKKPTIHGTRLN